MPQEKNEPLLKHDHDLPQVESGQPNSEQPHYTSEQLFQGQKEIQIRHHNETYRLRITKTDKLILTK